MFAALASESWSSTWSLLSDGVAILIIAVLLLLGAFLGYAPCVYVLGYCFEGGRTVPKSFSTAVNLYRRAGKLGFPLAWEKLGDLYAREGARFDPERAKKYYLLAYRAGITRDKAKAAKVGETKDKR